jgi:hypothetical protein
MDAWADVSYSFGFRSPGFRSPPCTDRLPTRFAGRWSTDKRHNLRYLKCIDKFFNNYISCLVTAGNIKFLLLHQPSTTVSATSSRSSTSIGANPTSPQTEEAIRNFFVEVYENYVKTIMSPFYRVNMEIRSPIFRSRVAAAGRKYL